MMEQSRKNGSLNIPEDAMLVFINGDSEYAEELETNLNSDLENGKTSRSVEVIALFAIKRTIKNNKNTA
jgi:hypothetical protein